MVREKSCLRFIKERVCLFERFSFKDDNSRRLYGNESTSGLGKFVRSDARKSQFTEEMLEVVAQLAEDRHRHAVMVSHY